LGPATPLDAQSDGSVAEGGAAFLLIPVGARAVALGQAAVADWGSGELAFWNPAGLALLPQSEVGIHHARTFSSNNTVVAGYVSVRRVGTFGVAAYLVDFGSQEVRPGPGPPTGRTTVRNIELLASYATTIMPSLAVGINYKLIQFRNDCSGDCGLFPTEVGTTHGLDLGVQYLVGEGNGLRLGLAIQHAGFALQIENRPQADPLPTRVQLGAQYAIALPTLQDSDPAYAKILFDLQDAWGSYSHPEARMGLELGLGELIRMRGGYAFLHSESRGPSIGAGVTFGRVTVDFARVFFESGRFDEPVYLTLRAAL
jgi:hypothetical protein